MNSLVTLLEILVPITNAPSHHSAMNVVEPFREGPRLLDVVNFESNVRRQAVRRELGAV